MNSLPYTLFIATILHFLYAALSFIIWFLIQVHLHLFDLVTNLLKLLSSVKEKNIFSGWTDRRSLLQSIVNKSPCYRRKTKWRRKSIGRYRGSGFLHYWGTLKIPTCNKEAIDSPFKAVPICLQAVRRSA